MTPKKDTLKFSHRVPVSMTLFGNRVFADGIELRGGHAGLGWAPNAVTGALIEESRTPTSTGAMGHVMTGQGME